MPLLPLEFKENSPKGHFNMEVKNLTLRTLVFCRWFATDFFLDKIMTTSHIFDTYAKTSKGKIMHFDVVLDDKDADKALAYAQLWLQSIGEEQAVVTQENCVFCHSVEVTTDLRVQIDEQGYAIYKLEGCHA